MLAFEAREGDLPVNGRMDHALNNATGKVWVSKQDFGLARVEFEMAKSVRFWGGIIGTLRNTVGRLDFDRIDEDVWLLTNLSVQLDLRILFRNIRRRISLDWEGYERRASDAVARARKETGTGDSG